MNYRQCFLMILMAAGMMACQSQTEQTSQSSMPAADTAPQTTAHQTVIPDANMPLPARQTGDSPSASETVTGVASPDQQTPTKVPSGTSSPTTSAVAANVVSTPDTQAPSASASDSTPDAPTSVATPAPLHQPAAPAVTKKTIAAPEPNPSKGVVSGKSVMQTVRVDEHAVKKCKACHHVSSAKKKVGPGWAKGDTGKGMQPGVFDRTAGASPGFKYKFTKYIKAGKAWKWDAAHLRTWMCNSKDAVKKFTGDPQAKTKMPPQHVCDSKKQDAIIAFMKSVS